MSTLVEEFRATEQDVAGAASALAEFWERFTAELGLVEEYVQEPITGTTACAISDYILSAIVRKPTRPSMVKAVPPPPVAEVRGSTPTIVRRVPGEERQRLKEVVERVKNKVRESRRALKPAPV